MNKFKKLHEARGQFHQCFMSSFCKHRSQKCKNTIKSSVSFYAFGICAHKSCSENIDEIDTWLSQAIAALRCTFKELSLDDQTKVSCSKVIFENPFKNVLCKCAQDVKFENFHFSCMFTSTVFKTTIKIL
jgi:hypothetical protein